jgi:deazaflavin-dependent oxidoreductase (nitroreductase family)
MSRDFLNALESADELSITFVGRKTGKKFTTPVWFVKEKGKVFLLPVKGTSSDWYRDILENPTMELQVSGMRATAAARPVRDRKGIEETIERFRAKYGAGDVKKYYPNQNAAVELSI